MMATDTTDRAATSAMPERDAAAEGEGTDEHTREREALAELCTASVDVDGVAAHLISYRVGARYGARIFVDDKIVARGRGPTRAEAEETALTAASVRLGLSQARDALRESVRQLPR